MPIDRTSIDKKSLYVYLTSQKLVLTTAESCTAGTIISMLSEIEGCGEFMDCGFATYSSESKQRLLGVNPETIEKYSLTSEEVAREMAMGALRSSPANVAVATTGVAGPEPMDGIPPGVVCVAWGYRPAHQAEITLFSRTYHLHGDRSQVRKQTSILAINGIIHFHRELLDGKSA